MITPRQTRLLRATDLAAFQQAIVECAWSSDAPVSERVILVPTGVAARLLGQTIRRARPGPVPEPDRADGGQTSPGMPALLTRDEWYACMHARPPKPEPRASRFEREVLFRAATRDALAAGVAPPFQVRPGLIPELLDFYETLARQQCAVDAFERLLLADLETSADIDRGARRLLEQTRFLVHTFRAYEQSLTGAGRIDEAGLRRWLLRSDHPGAFQHLVVTVADQAAEPYGLWPADFDMIARVQGLARIDVVVTERILAAGFHERIHRWLPGIEEARVPAARSSAGTLIVPSEGNLPCFVNRDREEELESAARTIKAWIREDTTALPAGPVARLSRIALVVERPLPYVYLADHVFDAAKIPFLTRAMRPLAAEPYAAAVDLVLSFVTSGFTRSAVVALLRSPHFRFEVDGTEVTHEDVAQLDRRLLAMEYLGGRECLELLGTHEGLSPSGAPDAHRAAMAAVAAARELAPLEEAGALPSRQLEVLEGFLETHHRPGDPNDSPFARQMRARTAISSLLVDLRVAHAQHDSAPRPFGELSTTIRKWIEVQTFDAGHSASGVQLVQAGDARYGEFDHLRVLGLIEGDWPARTARSIFYPSGLLGPLGWPRDRDRIDAARAAFQDLIELPRRTVSLSSFTLEEDVLVAPSPFLDDVDSVELTRVVRDLPRTRIFPDEALAGDPVVPEAVGVAAPWLALRLQRTSSRDRAFHGFVRPRRSRAHAVGAVEQYLECPFIYFARRVLRLETTAGADVAMSALERGRFIHRVLHAFFDEWERRGRGAVTVETFMEAMRLFEEVARPMVDVLPVTDRRIERARLFGSAAEPGLAERVLRVEAERPGTVVGRLLEYRLDGGFVLDDGSGPRRIELRGIADRIDLLADGTARVIDYKTGRAPDPRRAIQLPVYAVCAEQQLTGYRGRDWTVGEAGYVTLGGREPFVSMVPAGRDVTQTLIEGQRRCLEAVDGIARGEFPPRPVTRSLCRGCDYASVCRKDYVDAE